MLWNKFLKVELLCQWMWVGALKIGIDIVKVPFAGVYNLHTK